MTGRYELSDEGRQRVLLRYSGLIEPDFRLPPLLGVAALRSTVEEQFTAMVAEIERHRFAWRPETVFLGGGTPSSMALPALSAVLAAIPGRPPAGPHVVLASLEDERREVTGGRRQVAEPPARASGLGLCGRREPGAASLRASLAAGPAAVEGLDPLLLRQRLQGSGFAYAEHPLCDRPVVPFFEGDAAALGQLVRKILLKLP